MSFLNGLNRFVFRTRAGRLVVAAVAVLAGVILLNPLLSGIRATNEAGSSSLYSETGIYSDGTEVEIEYAGFGRPVDRSNNMGEMGDPRERSILRLTHYKGSSRLPFDFVVVVSESTQVGNNQSCDEQAFFQEFQGRRSEVIQDTRLPASFDAEPLGDQIRYKSCIRWSIIDGQPFVRESGPIEGGSSASSPSSPSPADYYLAVKIPETIGSPEVRQWFNRVGGQIYSRISLAPQSLDFFEYGDVAIGDRLPGDISVGYQYSVISDRAGCNQARFPGNLQGLFAGGSNYKQYRSASLSETEHEILILPEHVGKYICYKISWSDFGRVELIHDEYYVTFEVPPITEPEEIAFQPTEEWAPLAEETEPQKAEIEELRRIFEEAKLKAEEAKLKAEEDRLKAEEARLNAEEIKREQERQNYVSYAIPDEFDLDEAIRVFKSLLTEEGLEDIENTSFVATPHGCRYGIYENEGVGGCYVHDYTNSRHTIRIENTIYINHDYFPEDYAQRSRADKARIIKTAVDVLAHEFWHRNERANIGFNDIINECHESRSDKPFIDRFRGWFGVSSYNRPNYVEGLDSGSRQCMRDHPEWGHVFAGLEERFLDEDNPDPVKPVDVSSGSLWGGEDFSWQWYKEFYAETPTRNTHFPQALEDHYGRYFKDRTEYVDILRNDGLIFDIY